MFGAQGPLSFLFTYVFCWPGPTRVLGACVLRAGKLLHVSGDCKSCRKLDSVIEWTMYSARHVWMAADFVHAHSKK